MGCPWQLVKWAFTTSDQIPDLHDRPNDNITAKSLVFPLWTRPTWLTWCPFLRISSTIAWHCRVSKPRSRERHLSLFDTVVVPRLNCYHEMNLQYMYKGCAYFLSNRARWYFSSVKTVGVPLCWWSPIGHLKEKGVEVHYNRCLYGPCPFVFSCHDAVDDDSRSK